MASSIELLRDHVTLEMERLLNSMNSSMSIPVNEGILKHRNPVTFVEIWLKSDS